MHEFSKRISQKISKLSDSQIQTLLNKFAEKNEMLESVFQSISTGLIIVSNENDNFKILMKNKAVERILPFSDTKSENPIWTLISDSEISNFLKSTFESKKTNIRDEFTFLDSDEKVRFVDISISPYSQKKELVGSIVRVEDVTEKRNQEILLHRMEAMASLTGIAASVAHEIKNPLGAISIHIQLMQKAIKKKRESDGLLPDPKFAENYLDVVNSEIDRLNKIVVDFLMAVRPISAKLELSNPNKMLIEFVEFFKPEFSSKNIQIETEFCENCPRILIDLKLFREVIVNLAQNSISAIQSRFENFENSENSENSENGRLTLKTFVKNNFFVLEFCDNGIGMDNETCARVFEPYFTTKANGTGLGMAMSYKIIKEFSGDILVSSVLGEGTRFLISIPVPQKEKKLLTFDSNVGDSK